MLEHSGAGVLSFRRSKFTVDDSRIGELHEDIFLLSANKSHMSEQCFYHFIIIISDMLTIS